MTTTTEFRLLERVLRLRSRRLDDALPCDVVALGSVQQAALRREMCLPDDVSLAGSRLFGMAVRCDECVDCLAIE